MSTAHHRDDQVAREASNEADVELIARISAGDRDAFRRFYEKYYDPVLRFICRVTGQIESAQEGVNDVMLVIWTGSGKFRGDSKVSTWLMGIAYRKALQLAQQQRRWLVRFKSAEINDWNELLAGEPEPTSEMELRDWLEHGMRALSAKQRAVVELTHFYGYSYEEIARIADCPVNTVKTRMFHAREKLRRALPQLEKGTSSE